MLRLETSLDDDTYCLGRLLTLENCNKANRVLVYNENEFGTIESLVVQFQRTLILVLLEN